MCHSNDKPCIRTRTNWTPSHTVSNQSQICSGAGPIGGSRLLWVNDTVIFGLCLTSPHPFIDMIVTVMAHPFKRTTQLLNQTLVVFYVRFKLNSDYTKHIYFYRQFLGLLHYRD